MMVNWEFLDNQTPESATQLVDDLRAGNEVRSTRGPRICTWREAERVLAGFPDGLADEGPAAGPRRWSASRSPASAAGRPRGSAAGAPPTSRQPAADAATGRAESERGRRPAPTSRRRARSDEP